MYSTLQQTEESFQVSVQVSMHPYLLTERSATCDDIFHYELLAICVDLVHAVKYLHKDISSAPQQSEIEDICRKVVTMLAG